MINIRHITPTKELSKYVRKISIFKSIQKIEYLQKLTPSAYTYLSYHSGDLPFVRIGKKVVPIKTNLQIAGPKIRDDIYVRYKGKLNQILLEFSAYGFYYLFHKSPSNFVNKIINSNEFLSISSFNYLESVLKNCKEESEQIKIICEWLNEKSAKSETLCVYIEKAVKILEGAKGDISITDLTSKIFRSERQFNRRFHNIVGITPKHFSRICKLHHVINLMQKKEYESIQDLSFKGHYYDASSFSNEFKKLTGLSPSQFIESDDHIALKYFTDIPPQ